MKTDDLYNEVAKRAHELVHGEKDDNVRELKWIPGEKDPHGIDPKTGGAKMDYGKAPVRSLFMDYFPRAICAVANVSEYGARKYHAKGWEKVPNGPVRYGDAGARHAIKESIEGLYDDQDSGLSHAAQEAWNSMARLELMLKQGIVEDRIGNQLDPNNKPILGTARKA